MVERAAPTVDAIRERPRKSLDVCAAVSKSSRKNNIGWRSCSGTRVAVGQAADEAARPECGGDAAAAGPQSEAEIPDSGVIMEVEFSWSQHLTTNWDYTISLFSSDLS